MIDREPDTHRAQLAEMQRRFDEERRRERGLEASRCELMGWLSHDLRSPLAAIRAMAEAIEDGVVDDPTTIARYHRQICEETGQLAALVDDLFELSRANRPSLHLEFSAISLADVVSDALAGSAPIAAAKGVHLEARTTRAPQRVEASFPAVLRVVRNLLENAIRHTPSAGRILVEAGLDERFARAAWVSVHDEGGGVPDADLHRIFDCGYQGAPSAASGTGGLGLAIAKTIADAHRGELTVGNENGGARFTLRLPELHGR